MKIPQGHGLLVAEKSSLMKDIQAVYQKNIGKLPYTLDFECFAGHVVELPMPEEFREDWGGNWNLERLPMIPENWHYKRSENKGKRYDSVMSAIESGKYSFIINAGDPEREGQLIQDAFYSTMKDEYQKLPRYRMWFNDTQDDTLLKSLQNLLLPNDHIPNLGTVQNLSDASFLRARFDWLIGLNLTQALAVKLNANVTVGRVQTPTLKVLVDRELAIRNFKIKPFWTIRIYFQHDNGVYLGSLLDDDGKIKQFFDKDEAVEIAESLKNTSTGSIKDKVVKQVKENPPKYYSTAKLQGDAAKIYGISPSESLSTLQWFYEQKILSYPRTDSQNITDAMSSDLKAMFITAKEDPQLNKFDAPQDDDISKITKNKNYVNDGEVRGHTALVPLPNVIIDYDKMTEMQQKIFYLVARSIVLPFLGPIEKEKTEIITEFGGYLFKTTGSVIKKEGWMSAVPEYNAKDQVLPELCIGDQISVDRHELKDGKTTPPKPYTPEAILSVLENIHTLLDDEQDKTTMKRAEGLGRPSTRTAILSDLEKHQFVNVEGKKQEYHATDFGIDLVNALGDALITSPLLTATWEGKLQDLEDGKITSDQLYQEMVDYTKKVISEVKKLDIKLEHVPARENKVVGILSDGSEILEGKTGYYNNEFLTWMSKNKEAKNSGKDLPPMRGFWLSKKFSNQSFEMMGSFTKSDVKKLISGEEIEKEFHWKKNNTTSKAKLKLNEQFSLEFVKKKSNQTVENINSIDLYKIQRIYGTKADGATYDLYRFEDPEFVFSRTIGDYTITEKDLKLLVNGETIKRELISKKNKPFQANLFLEIGKGLKMEPIKSNGVKVSDNVTQYEKDGRIYYQLANGVYVQSVIAGHTMTIRELERLYIDGYIFIEDFVSKSNKQFSATLAIVNGQTTFVFDK